MRDASYIDLTPEDERIWRRICCFSFHIKAFYVCAESAARKQDHRCGNLMLNAQRTGLQLAQADPFAEVVPVRGVFL